MAGSKERERRRARERYERQRQIQLERRRKLRQRSLIGLAVVKDDDRVRFHCAQALAYSVVTWVIAIVIGLIPFLGWVLGPLLWVAIFVIGLVLALQAGSGKDPKLPVLADFAEKNLVNLFK